MRATSSFLAACAAVVARAANITTSTSLADACTVANAQAALPADGFLNGSTIVVSSVTAAPVYNASSNGNVFYPDTTNDFCNVTFAYTHTSNNITVQVAYYLPTPSNYKGRFLATGGGGYAINSGLAYSGGSLAGGVSYGAVAGLTDAGFGAFTKQVDTVQPIANGTSNPDAIQMFGYQAIHEMTLLGQEFSKSFFGSSSLYTYYQGCSEGGRDGFSQVQRFADLFDGAAIGAPALRFSQQQIQHSWSNVVEQNANYFPSACEFEAITNATLALCDPLDGKTDGVVSRSDLCKLQFDYNTTIGIAYDCAASEAFNPVTGGATSVPASTGNVTAQGAAVAKAIIDGWTTDDGKRAYFSYQPGAVSFNDGATALNSTSGEYELSINTMGTEFVTRFIQILDTDTFDSFAGVTGTTLRDWAVQGMNMYADVLQTTQPDLSAFQAAGGKILHFHGESDNSIPTASSVRYHESVRSVMYGNMTFNESTAALADWYQLYLVPGAAHCGTNSLEANGPFPQTNLAVLIDWVESDVTPTTLNSTHLAGDAVGTTEQLCAWPLRPMFASNDATDPECVYDQASIDSWIYDLDAFNVTVY